MKIRNTDEQAARLDHYVNALKGVDSHKPNQLASTLVSSGLNGMGGDGSIQPTIVSGSQIDLSNLDSGGNS